MGVTPPALEAEPAGSGEPMLLMMLAGVLLKLKVLRLLCLGLEPGAGAGSSTCSSTQNRSQAWSFNSAGRT